MTLRGWFLRNRRAANATLTAVPAPPNEEYDRPQVRRDPNIITVSPVGQNQRNVQFDRMTGLVTAGCFRGDLDAFYAQIIQDYGMRIRSAPPENAAYILKWRSEYLLTAEYFKSLTLI